MNVCIWFSFYDLTSVGGVGQSGELSNVAMSSGRWSTLLRPPTAKIQCILLLNFL